MLQADVLPNMGFSSTRKRLVHAYECLTDHEESMDNIDGMDNKDGGPDTSNETPEETIDQQTPSYHETTQHSGDILEYPTHGEL
jgi:hypothetical protein